MKPKVFEAMTPEEKTVFERLDTPLKLQYFLENELEYNLEEKGETCYSPRLVLRHKKANCLEGAIFAAAVLYYHGQPPLLGQLLADARIDDDHVLALFTEFGHIGCISKSKYPYLSYREPIHKNLRELALSYFENYYSYEEGIKSIRGYAKPLDLRKFDTKNWVLTQEPLFCLIDELDKMKETKLLTPQMVKNLRPLTPLAKRAGEIWIHERGLMDYLIEQQKK